jgi:hypothetical protein
MSQAPSFELSDLNPTELAALVALVKIGSRSDHSVSKTEELMLDVLRLRLGEEVYGEVATHVDRHIVDQASLRRLLQSVTRPEARELILGTALQILSAETVNSAEDRVLSLASETWNLQPKFLDFPEGDDEPVGPGGEGGSAMA